MATKKNKSTKSENTVVHVATGSKASASDKRRAIVDFAMKAIPSARGELENLCRETGLDSLYEIPCAEAAADLLVGAGFEVEPQRGYVAGPKPDAQEAPAPAAEGTLHGVAMLAARNEDEVQRILDNPPPPPPAVRTSEAKADRAEKTLAEQLDGNPTADANEKSWEDNVPAVAAAAKRTRAKGSFENGVFTLAGKTVGESKDGPYIIVRFGEGAFKPGQKVKVVVTAE